MSRNNFEDTTVKIQTIELEKNKRILVVSDIHGCVNYLEGVLKKVSYSEQDALVIVGDIIEKGPESLKTVRYILKLKEENFNVYATIGNVDYSRLESYFDNSPEGNRNFIKGLEWSKHVWECGFFLDILDEMGIDIGEITKETVEEIKAKIGEKYAKELNFFRELPTILHIGNFIFVHAGIPTDRLDELTGTEGFRYLKQDAFLNADVTFQNTVVVGHWPVCLYREEIDSMNPIFDYKKHIIAIDGGCALKYGAQLNVLLIPDANAGMEEVTYAFYDDFPVMVAEKDQKAREKSIVVRYYDCQVELLEENEDMVKLLHCSSGKVFLAPKSYLYKSKDGLCCSDYTDACLEVKQGDVLSVVEKTSAGYMVKKDGVIGWYR